MVWANWAVLGLGAAMLVLPVVLHLLMQPKPKELEFPALKFVRKREFKNRSRMRLRHLVLLLMRCLLIGLLAAALAGPSVASREFGQWLILGGIGISALVVLIALLAVWFGSRQPSRWLAGTLGLLLAAHLAFGAWSAAKLWRSDSAQLIGNSAAPVSALIVVDTSCRMAYRQQNQSNLDRAKETAAWIIDQFPSESEVCVLATDNDTPFFSVDPSAARNRTANLETSFTSVPIPDRIAAGLKLLDEATHERREIYIISDLTERGWAGSQSKVAKELEIEQATSLFVFDVGQTEPANFTLAPLRLPRTSLTQMGELKIDSSVSRLGSAAQRTVRFRLERPNPARPSIRDGKVLVPDQYLERVRTVDVRKDSSAPVSFLVAERLPLGIHHGSVEIVGDDSLPVDDVRHFTIEVVPAWDVLVVHGDDVNPDNLTVTITDEGDTGMFRTQVVSQQQLPARLDDFAAIFLLDPGGISETTWKTLYDYVEEGHGLAIFLGANAAAGSTADRSFQSESATKLLAGRLTRQWRRTDASLFLSPDSLDHPIFAPFRDWETGVPWFDFPVFVHWGLESDDRWEELPTQTVLRYGNANPAIVERRIGAGLVMVMTTPITESENVSGRRAWNSLFTGVPLPAWVLVRELASYLVQSRSDRLNLLIGELVRLKNDYRRYPDSYRIFTPRTKQNSQSVAATDGVVRYRFTGDPGQYRLRGVKDGPVLRGFSVNLEEGETDLTRLQPAELDTILGAGRYQLASERNEIQRQQGATRRGQEFYPLLLLMLCVVMAVEYLLSNRFYS